MESFAAGRVARGEEHLYRSFSTRLQVSFSARPVLVDASSFRPGEASPALEGALASSGFVGTIFALSQQGDHEELATLISRRLASLPGVYGGAAALASGYGAVGRFLADDAPNLRMATQVAWDVARRHMRGRPAPLLRK
ncbi:urease accessory protein UreD [Enterobacter hormaechei]